MMKLTRAGIGVAIAGGLALAVHGLFWAGLERWRSDRALQGMLLARQARQRSDCATWEAARQAILELEDEPLHGVSHWTTPAAEQWIVTNALDDPDMRSLWRARSSLASSPELVWLLLPALRDPSFVGLEDAADVTVVGRGMRWYGHGMMVREDLFTRAGRASWLLKGATGHSAAIVGVRTDTRLLPDISNDWRLWLGGVDGGDACRPAALLSGADR